MNNEDMKKMILERDKIHKQAIDLKVERINELFQQNENVWKLVNAYRLFSAIVLISFIISMVVNR